MKYIRQTNDGTDLEDYLDYIRTAGVSFPSGARSYVSATGRYSIDSPACHPFHLCNTIQPKAATCRDETTTGEAVSLCRGLKTCGAANDNSRIYLCFASGNLTNDGVRTYSYDAADRLIRINYAGNATKKSEFGYDGLGRRITQTETPTTGAAVTTRNLWCGSRLCQERTSADVVTVRYYPEGERRPVAVEAYVYMPDSLGSVRELVGAGSGILKFAYDYDAYGKPTRSWTNVSSADTKFRYAGLMYHVQSGLYLSTTRAYDPTRGKWINRDPIREAGGVNLYNYPHNPISDIDPMGLQGAVATPGISPPITRPGTGVIAGGGLAAICADSPWVCGAVIVGGICYGIYEMARPSTGTCSCQHRDVFTSGGSSCQVLRENGMCTGPYKGSGSDTASCQANAREQASDACKGCLGHCLFTPSN